MYFLGLAIAPPKKKGALRPRRPYRLGSVDFVRHHGMACATATWSCLELPAEMETSVGNRR